MAAPSIGWSDFARERYRPGQGHSSFDGSEAELVALIDEHWERRRPGTGRRDLDRVVLVPLPPHRFTSGILRVSETTALTARFRRRQQHEEGYIEVLATGSPEPARFACAVLYSAATLLENEGSRSGDWDWEIVSLQAGPLEDEPMRPLTMARNFLGSPGGTPCDYTARQFAEAIRYWSDRCGSLPESDPEI